jgi:hypothetical protein
MSQSQPKPLLDQISQHTREQLLELQRERSARQLEPLKLYRPHDYQKPLHECIANEIVVLGGNRSGKTLASAMEFAWAVTGTHPVKGRYPLENGNAAIVCSGWRHVGMVLAPLLLKAGAFSVIRDEVTGDWRSYDPVKDRPRRAEIKPAPPLIPPRLIAQQSWLLKAANQIQTMTLTNGWNIQFYSSEGDPFQGIAMDLIWVDEDITNDGNWLSEMQARLGDRKGRLIWSAMPHSRNDALLGLSERADKAEETGQNHIKKFVFRFLDNPAIEDEEKRKMVERWAAQGNDTLRMRAEGEFTFDSLLVYPNYSTSIHGMERKELPEERVPHDWTRYAVVDPGHAVTAVLFAAVPPSGDFCLLYDELYIRNCNAVIFGDRFKETVGSQPFYAFLIDAHGARLTDIGSGRSPQEQYTEVLVGHGVRSRMTGSSFIPGCDDIQAGLSAVRTAMHIRSNGTPFLRILRGSCPNLERELKRYKKKSVNVGGQTIVTDEPNKRGEFHLVDCLRYLMAYSPKYHKPEANTEKPWWFDWKQKRDRAANKGSAVYLAPASYTSEVYYA